MRYGSNMMDLVCLTLRVEDQIVFYSGDSYT